MQNVAAANPSSEQQFAELVDELAADTARSSQLTELLREDNQCYDRRGAATTIRMRGWVLLALGRVGISDAALLFVLEELDTGVDAYLVAAAARALRSYPDPHPSFAPFVMRSLTNIRYHDEIVSFEKYGDYAVSNAGTSAVRELLATLTWLGPSARGVLPDVELLRGQQGGLPKKFHVEIDQAVRTIREHDQCERSQDTCCKLPNGIGSMLSWRPSSRGRTEPIEETLFEDQDGSSLTFKEFFSGQPSIVVFFYTRCDNPLKCSLTITKLARIQKLLAAQGIADRIKTAAITYDSAFDLPPRLRSYGKDRDVLMSDRHRMLRTMDGFESIRRHFKLGVNFVESLVNRHRIEVYILDAAGRIAASFERIHWNEKEVVDRAIDLLNEKNDEMAARDVWRTTYPGAHRTAVSPMIGTLASLGIAFFPKCPICWAGYLSVFGIAGLEQIPYAPWLLPVLVATMLISLISMWIRGRSTGQMSGFYLVVAGVTTILVLKTGLGWENAAVFGSGLMLVGSLLSALGVNSGLPQARD